MNAYQSIDESEGASRFVAEMLRIMVSRRAADLFLTAGFPPAVKLDGRLHPISPDPLNARQTFALSRAVMTDRQQAEFDESNECNFALQIAGLGRFRVNVFRQQGCVGIVMRAIQDRIPTLAELGMPPVLSELAMARRGIVIVVGATGAGKSTTCASLIDHRNRNANDHILTIEDPIEFVHVHRHSIITQREIGSDTDGWDIALKNAMRQAPDVIMIGELRDRDAIEQAISFAETGHLCLATMHSTNAFQVIDRIINHFPEDRRAQLLMHLSLNLRAFISQRLVPRKGGSGRIAAIEVLINTPLMSDLIFKGDLPHLREQMKKMRDYGMQTFDQHLFELYEADFIEYEDALRNADSVNDLRLNIKLNSKRPPPAPDSRPGLRLR
jgi:twitching motility protein PilU